ncbi:N-formylglutamate amidohydrolase [Parerythrobacter jejuensis]
MTDGGQIPGSNHPAFTLQMAEKSAVPILLAVPHAGRHYPESLRERMRDPEFSTLRLEDRMVDVLARDLAGQTGAPLIVAHAPRAMLDLNRADDDMDWSMIADGSPTRGSHSRSNRRARSGLGLIPRRLSGLGEIWRQRIDHGEVTARIESVHAPYHKAVSQALSALRQQWGAALLIDMHSMPPLKKRHPDDTPAEFVIGDRFGASSDGMFSAAALRYLARQDRRAAHNRPYAGGYVLDRHGKPSLGIHAIQLEICRTLYLDSRLSEPSARLPALAKMLAGLVRNLADEVSRTERDKGLPIAAE